MITMTTMHAPAADKTGFGIGGGGPFILPPTPPSQMDDIQLALYLSVLHYGLANLWEGDATPASKQTVAIGGDYFLNWIEKQRAQRNH